MALPKRSVFIWIALILLVDASQILPFGISLPALLVYLFIIRPRRNRVKAREAEREGVPTYRFPFGEYREAITAELSPGEQLLAACECYTNRVGEKEKAPQMSWFILALTNINLRQYWWRSESSASIPEVGGMNTFPIGDVASHQYGSERPLKEVRERLDRSFGDWSATGVEGEIAVLTLGLSNGKTFKAYSPHEELRHFTKQLDALKSGALIVDNTAAVADALDQLVPLLNDGILTQEEFDRAKDGFLGATVEVRESSVGLLRQLHSLHKSGVLSESEFNMKKWDVLSKDG